MITEKSGRDIGEFPVFWRRDAEFCILRRHLMQLVRDLFLFLRKNKPENVNGRLIYRGRSHVLTWNFPLLTRV